MKSYKAKGSFKGAYIAGYSEGTIEVIRVKLFRWQVNVVRHPRGVAIMKEIEFYLTKQGALKAGRHLMDAVDSLDDEEEPPAYEQNAEWQRAWRAGWEAAKKHLNLGESNV